MIIVRLIGGLGNQLFQYCIGRKLAMRHQVPVKLDLSVYDNDASRECRLHFFNVSYAVASPKEVNAMVAIYENDAFYAKVYRKLEKKFLPKYRRKYFVEHDYYMFEPDLLKVGSKVLIEGFWQHHRYYQDLPQQILAEFTLKNEFVEKYGILDQIAADHRSVSVHIRRGDYVSDPNNLSWFGILSPDYYQRAMAYIESNIKDPRYYIFSDDLDWARDHLAVNTEAVYVDIAKGQKEYLELEAMRRCRHHIIANSSFSWWGAFLNENPDKLVIAPSKWLAQEALNRNVQIQMPAWIKL